MCAINNMLNAFKQEKHIGDNVLEYRYTGNARGVRLHCSADVGITYSDWHQNRNQHGRHVDLNINRTYSDWHERLPTDPEGVITEILNWGFGERNDDDRRMMINRYYNSISQLLQNVPGQDNIVQIDQLLFQRRGNLFTQSWNNIASWSKVLAAYNPDNFFIYDSRVAMALNIIDNECGWYLPAGKGHNIVLAIIKQNQTRGQVRTLKESYRCYCESLRQHGGVTLERQLFMLGKMLDFQSNAWRRCIFVNPELVNE